MIKRIVVPSEDQNGLNARLAEHFGRAPYYTIIDFDENDHVLNVGATPNVSEHVGGVGIAPDHILSLSPTALIVFDMGPRAINIFKNAGVTVLKANANMVSEVIAAYKESKLSELTEGCDHSHIH